MNDPQEIRRQELERDRLLQINGQPVAERRDPMEIITHAALRAPLLEQKVRELELQNQELQKKYDELRGAVCPHVKERDDALRLLNEVVALVPHTVGAHTEGFPCDECVALKKLGINRTSPFERPKSDGWHCPVCNLITDRAGLPCPDCAEKRFDEIPEWQVKYEHVLGLLRDTKMKHGTCQPRSRKACTACNAQEELDKIVKDWKGFTMTLS